MSLSEFFSQYNIPLLIFILEYFELFSCISSCVLMYLSGRVGLSMGITSSCMLVKLLFDHFWMYFVFLRDFNGHQLMLWYNGFALSEFLTIVAIFHLHRLLKVEFWIHVRIFLFLHFSNLVLLCFRYWERTIFSSDHLKYIYKFSIPTVNVLGTVILFSGACLAYKKSKTFSQRIPWGWE